MSLNGLADVSGRAFAEGAFRSFRKWYWELRVRDIYSGHGVFTFKTRSVESWHTKRRPLNPPDRARRRRSRASRPARHRSRQLALRSPSEERRRSHRRRQHRRRRRFYATAGLVRDPSRLRVVRSLRSTHRSAGRNRQSGVERDGGERRGAPPRDGPSASSTAVVSGKCWGYSARDCTSTFVLGGKHCVLYLADPLRSFDRKVAQRPQLLGRNQWPITYFSAHTRRKPGLRS